MDNSQPSQMGGPSVSQNGKGDVAAAKAAAPAEAPEDSKDAVDETPAQQPKEEKKSVYGQDCIFVANGSFLQSLVGNRAELLG